MQHLLLVSIGDLELLTYRTRTVGHSAVTVMKRWSVTNRWTDRQIEWTDGHTDVKVDILWSCEYTSTALKSLSLTWPLRHIHDITTTQPCTALTEWLSPYWVWLLQQRLTGWLNIFLKPLHHHSCPKFLSSSINIFDCEIKLAAPFFTTSDGKLGGVWTFLVCS